MYPWRTGLGPTPALQVDYAKRWREDVKAAGLPEAEIIKADERMAYNRCTTVEDQLRWMRQAGLVDVDCSVKAFRFAVLNGRRSA